jgi:hypothetical protein
MSPNLAALLTWSFVAFLLIRNARHRSECLPGLWVPTIWILILGSRSPNQWFVGEGAGQSVDAYEDGNGFNQVVYLGLIVLATFVLLYRRVQWADIFRRNRALLVFLGYCIVSLVWADYPLVSFKGAIKAIFGNFVMAAVVVTDPRPVEAVKTMIRRCTYVLIPLSVLVIKYYPLIGRETHRWTYETM